MFIVVFFFWVQGIFKFQRIETKGIGKFYERCDRGELKRPIPTKGGVWEPDLIKKHVARMVSD